jgi:hypothetical protein
MTSLLQGLSLILLLVFCAALYVILMGPDAVRARQAELASAVVPLTIAGAQKTPEPPQPAAAVSEPLHPPESKNPQQAPDSSLTDQTSVTEHVSDAQPNTQQDQPVEAETAEQAAPEITPPPSIALAQAPIPSISEKTPSGGILPVRGSDAKDTAFSLYRAPSLKFLPGQNIVGIALTDYGLSDNDSQTALASLPPKVTFILSPYAQRPQEWINKARADGHEVWLSLPIEQADTGLSDQGALALTSRNGQDNNQRAYTALLSLANGYTGLAVSGDSNLQTVLPFFDSFIQDALKRGLALWEINPAAPRLLETMAESLKSPFIRANIRVRAGEESQEALQLAETQAASSGRSLIVIDLNAASVQAISLWLADSTARGIILAPASSFADDRL